MQQEQRIGGPRPIDQLIRDFLREQGLGTGGRRERVFKAWAAAVGPALAVKACPVRFRNGELIVEVASAVQMHELKSFTGENYRKKANEHLGSETIRRVTFKLKV